MKKYASYRFSGINIKRETAVRFRTFSKEISLSNTEALEAMLNFFSTHELSPTDSIDGNLKSMELRIKRRISNAIAIIKSIERSQTLPTTAMLQSLFNQESSQSNVDDDFFGEHLEFIEKKSVNTDDSSKLKKETTVPRIRYERLEEKLEQLKVDFGYFLGNVKPIKSTFGKQSLKLDITAEELERYKRKLKNI